MKQQIAKKKCTACTTDAQPLKGKALEKYLKDINDGWKLVRDHHIEKEYLFKNFREGLEFVNELGKVADEIGHHPYVCLAWGKVMLALWTHKIDGLTENDFILAAKCDEAHQSRFGKKAASA